MGIDAKDNEVLQLLKKLKDANGAYPQDLLALRRQTYLKQVAEIGGAAGLAVGLKTAVKAGKAGSVSSATGTFLEGLLVVAIIAEASTMAYFYRDKISQFFQNFSNQPKVEEVSNPPVIPSAIVEVVPTGATPVVTVTGTATPVVTPSLMAVQPTSSSGGNTTGTTAGGGGSQAVATAEPNGKNGNQYGLTPKPERTKDPGGNSSGNNSPSNPEDSKKKAK